MKNLEINQMENLQGGLVDCGHQWEFIAGATIVGGLAGLGVGALFAGWTALLITIIQCNEQ